MDHETKNRIILLVLDGSRLISTWILQQMHHGIDELLADNLIHTKVGYLRDSGTISDEHFHLLFPPTDLSKWDETITSHFLKHCTDIEEPTRTFLETLRELRNKAMNMYQHHEMSNEDYTSELERTVNILKRGKSLLDGPIVKEIDETINRIKQTPVTPEGMKRINSWYDLQSKYKDTDTDTGDSTEYKYVVHEAAYYGKLSTFQYMRNKFPDRLLERDKDGNQAVHFAAGGGHIECLRFVFELFPDMQMARNEKEMDALHCAARDGRLDCLTFLISQGMNTDTRTKEGDTLLNLAAYGGSLSMLQYIYERFSELRNKRNKKGQDALYMAARGGNLDCLKYLIDQGMNTDTRSKYGSTLLHAAAYGGIVSMVEYVFETIPDIRNETDQKEMDALFSAARGDSLECLIYLIGQGMTINTRCTYGSTILHSAAYVKSFQIVQYICETFPDLIKEKNKKGQNALHSAVRGGSIDCLEYLVDQGLTPDTQSKTGNTLLHTAVYGGSVPMVQYVWKTFPKLQNAKNQQGEDATFSAVHGNNLDSLKYLIGQGLTPNTRSKTGNTLLHTAVYEGYVPMVQYVWETFPYLQKERNQKGKDAPFSALHGNSLECLKYLISHGMNTDTRSINGHTLLEEAAYNGNVLIVQYICETFAYWKTEGNQKETDALFCAIRGRSLVCVNYLISQGMNTNTRTKYGETLLHVAAFAGSLSIVQYICETFPEMKYEVNTKGEDSLHNAARGGSLPCLIYLIGQEMTIYSWSKHEETILHQASFHGHEGVVRYICENYVQLLSYKQNHGRTAIYSAVTGGHLEILKYLIIQIDPKQTDTNGHTILHAAAKNGKTDIVRYLCTTCTFLISINGFRGETAIDLAHRNGHFDCIKVIQERL